MVYPRGYVPFAWQVGSRLLLMDRSPDGWVVAELHFHARFGHYEERRRVTYDSPREAAGVMMAALVSDDPVEQELMAAAVTAWFGEFTVVS